MFSFYGIINEYAFIQSFDDEAEAFMAYAKENTGDIILLVDTYNTLKSGIPNVIKAATELKKQNRSIYAIRVNYSVLCTLIGFFV